MHYTIFFSFLYRYYIVGYVNWAWTLTTVLIPLFMLLFLTISIFSALRKVRKNLNRHKRLETRARRVVANIKKTSEPSCTIQVKVTNENGVGKCHTWAKLWAPAVYFGIGTYT